MRLSLYEYKDGVETKDGLTMVYDVARNEAHYGAAKVDGHAIVWVLGDDETGSGAKLSAEVNLDPSVQWLMRCDRVDFPPGGVAWHHQHPGPGIRQVLFGEITIDTQGRTTLHHQGDAWFETGPDTVFAPASETQDTAFVRVLLLPREWEGKRTIKYVDPSEDDKPRLQYATIFLEQNIELPE